MKILNAIVLLGLSGVLVYGALSPDLGAGADGAGGLTRAVASIAEKSKNPAQDYALLAEETLRFGQRPDAVDKLNQATPNTEDPQGPWRNMIGDALAGVDEGERMDTKAADWPRLREELKKLQPPRPPPSKDKQDSKDKKKDKSKKDKKSGKDKGEPQEKDKGEGEKSEGKEGEKGEDGEKGDSQSPPSSGKGNQKGKKGEKGENLEGGEGDSDEKGEQGKEQKEAKGKQKDPNQIKDYSTSKEGEGKMKDRAKEEDLAPIQDQKAGFGGLGEEKKDQGKKEGKGVAQGGEDSKKDGKEAPSGMRSVGGGSGKKKQDESTDAYTMEATARLDQVRQSDSPALLQQRLQPKDQRPSPSSTAKPW